MPASDVSAARGPTKSNLGDKGLLFYSDRIRTRGPYEICALESVEMAISLMSSKVRRSG